MKGEGPLRVGAEPCDRNGCFHRRHTEVSQGSRARSSASHLLSETVPSRNINRSTQINTALKPFLDVSALWNQEVSSGSLTQMPLLSELAFSRPT